MDKINRKTMPSVRRARLRRGVLRAAAAVALAAAAAFVFDVPGRLYLTGGALPQTAYREFYRQVESEQVTAAELESARIVYTTADGRFTTDNPQSPLLKEFLLRHGVSVKEKTDAGSAVTTVLDALFYVLFFGSIVFVFRRFISPYTFRAVRHTGVTFDDVVGMDSVKRSMLQVIDVLKHPEEYRRRGIRLPKGILLEGAPGNGKTLFARAVAGQAGVRFIAAKATDFESMFMAIGPAKVKLLFHKARRCAPCIVFIDEFDGIGTRRNYTGSAIETENTRIVTALLNELDGFTPNNGIVVLAATNSIQALDEALIRPGRFDSRFVVPYPDEADRQALVRMYSAGRHPAPECTPEILARSFSGFSCAKIESVINNAALLAARENRAEFTMADIQAAVRM